MAQRPSQDELSTQATLLKSAAVPAMRGEKGEINAEVRAHFLHKWLHVRHKVGMRL